MEEQKKPWEIPSAELSLRLTELVQTSSYDSDVVEVDKDMVTQAASRIAAFGAMEKELKELKNGLGIGYPYLRRILAIVGKNLILDPNRREDEAAIVEYVRTALNAPLLEERCLKLYEEAKIEQKRIAESNL